MPSKISKEELKKLVASGHVRALTIDTNIFVKHGFKFNEGLLDTLKQFESSRFQFLLSEIVIRESKRHITKKHNDFLDKWEGMLRSLSRYSFLEDHTKALATEIEYHVEPGMLASQEIDQFILNTGVTTISSDHAKQEDVLDRYFRSAPPFNLKKKEFPDAIALLGIEEWARSTKSGIVVVSDDTDWADFCESSPQSLYQVADLATALEVINDTQQARNERAEKRLSILVDQITDRTLNENVKEQLIRKLKMDSTLEASSEKLSFVADIFKVDASDIKITKFTKIRDDEVAYATLLDFSADCWVSANFEFYDELMKHHIGRGKYTLNRIVNGLVLVTVTDTDFEAEVMLDKKGLTIDFGDVEPDDDGITVDMPN